MVIDEFPDRPGFDRYVRVIEPNILGRYGIAASKKESPRRIVDVDIDPWSRSFA